MTNINKTNRLAFNQWLKKCPVSFASLSEYKSNGQVSYVFYLNDSIEGGN